jgi:hypothetical protein
MAEVPSSQAPANMELESNDIENSELDELDSGQALLAAMGFSTFGGSKPKPGEQKLKKRKHQAATGANDVPLGIKMRKKDKDIANGSSFIEENLIQEVANNANDATKKLTNRTYSMPNSLQDDNFEDDDARHKSDSDDVTSGVGGDTRSSPKHMGITLPSRPNMPANFLSNNFQENIKHSSRSLFHSSFLENPWEGLVPTRLANPEY